MSDLAQLLAQFEREEYAASVDAQLPDTRRHAVRGKVVRARRVRAAATIAVAAVAAVACGTGAWALTQSDRNDPAVPEPSPTITTPSPSPTPSASVTPEPVLTMPAFTGDVTVDPQLPSAEAITPEAWNAAGPGWVLATYGETVYHYDDATLSDSYTLGPQVAYLISPDGVRFQLSAIQGQAKVRVVAWAPLSTFALAIEETGPANMTPRGTWVTLDLASGATHPLTDADVTGSDWDASSLEGLSRATAGAFGGDGQTIENAAPLELLAPAAAPSTTGSDEAAALVTAQGLVPTGEICKDPLTLATSVAVACGPLVEEVAGETPGGWYTHEVVFVSALGSGNGTAVDVRIPSEYGPVWPDPSFWHHPWQNIGDAVVAMAIGEGPYACPDGRYVIRPSGIDPLPGVEALKAANESANIFYDAGVVDESVYTVVTGGCSGSAMPSALVRDDIASGTSVVLIPFPPSTGQYSDSVTDSIESAYVVPSRP